MPVCSVPYCGNATAKDSLVSFHEFPHETQLFLNKWIENIGRPNWRPGLRSVVCSDHFEKGDFDRKGRLHIGSFPSKFPEAPTTRKKKKEDGDPEPTSNPVSLQQGKTPIVLVTPLEHTASTPASKKIIKSCIAAAKTPQNEKLVINKVSSNKKEQATPRTVKVAQATKDASPDFTIVDISDENEVPPLRFIGKPSAGKAPFTSMSLGFDQKIVPIGKSDKSSSINQTIDAVVNRTNPTKDLNILKKKKILETGKPSEMVASVSASYSLLSCRICGTTHKTNIDIYGQEGKNKGVADMISRCLPIEVKEYDSYPKQICQTCFFRLKDFSKMMSVCSKTNEALRGTSDPKGTSENSIYISKSTLSQPSSQANRRVLLLEMSLKEGIPVKNMIHQAVQELNLRLKPKESRESKPQGRIMFLDLQGGKDAFPEQMKKAISLLFPGAEEANPGEKRKVVNEDGKSNVSEQKRMKTVTNQIPLIINDINSSMTATNTVFVTTASGQSKVAVTNTVPSTLPVQKVPPRKGFGVSAINSINLSTPSLTPLIMKPLTSIAHSPSLNQNLIVQPQPVLSSLPLAMIPSTSATSSALRISLPASTLPSNSVPHLVRIPSNFVKISPKPAQGTPIVLPANDSSNVASDDDDHCYDDHCYAEELPQLTDQDIPMPSLVPFKESTSKSRPKESKSPQIDISQLKDKVITKINNMGKQFKLGDKIVGIVLRNSDSREDIHKKLQATFSSKGTPQKDQGKTIMKPKESITFPKERAILPKGDSILTITGETTIASEVIIDGTRKLKERPMDVHATVDSPSSYFDRRNARKLSLSFMWRKSGYLVSSYQKLFTWQLSADSTDMSHLLTCRVCQFAAKSRADVESHLQAHPDLQCTVCWKYFLTSDKVVEHMNIIHNITNPSETLRKKCWGVTLRQNTLRRTILRQYQCSRCERRFKLKESLQRHTAVCKERTLAEKVQAITKGNLLSCPTCHRNFNTPEELQDHVVVHTKRTSWLCDICGLVLKSASNYRGHIARHDEYAADYKYQCNTCKKRFKLLHRYETHMKKHDVRQQYICSSCGKVFNTINGLRQHEVLHGERKLQCKYCPSRFHRRDHLRIHEASHTKAQSADGVNTSRRSFTCRFCVAKDNTVVKFPNMRELMRHYNDDHAEERANAPQGKKYECDRCTRSFANSTLLKHHHMWHAGLRPYSCSHCGMGFMIKERLRNHEMTHTNERPYKCQVCGKGFRSRNCLKQHKAIHMDPNDMFKCKYCDKTFSRIDNLRTHTRVHTGEKPWKCLHCQKQFRLRSECTKHIQIAHQVPAEEVSQYVETANETQETVESESNSSTSVIDAALRGITTVQDMELLIEPEDLEEDSDSL